MARRMFGIKDLFTSLNVLAGAAALFLCVDDRPFAAGVVVMLGYLFGDVPDGWVARKLGTSNKFGSEFDSIADHVTHVAAPAAIVYSIYADAALLGPPWANRLLAGTLAGLVILLPTIRHARNAVQPVEYPGVWVGLPRTVMGFAVMGYALSTLAPHAPGGLWLGVVLIPALCVATLTHLPFANHRLPRKHFLHVRLLIAATFVTHYGALLVAPRFAFDILFFWMMGYVLSAFLALSRDERVAFRGAVQAALRAPAA